MCNCSHTTCPQCDPGIEAFYQQKVEEAKAEAARLEAVGYVVHYQDLLDAKDIWYEYCDLRAAEKADDLGDKIAIEEMEKVQELYDNQDHWANEQCAKDMEIDAAVELQAMCESAAAEEAYWKAERNK